MSERTRLCSFQILLINSRLKRDASLWSGAQLPKSGDRFVASVCGGTRGVACFVSFTAPGTVRADLTVRLPACQRPVEGEYQRPPESRAEGFVPSGAVAPGL